MIMERMGAAPDTHSSLVASPADRNAALTFMPAPLISVVLVCRNPGPRVRDALASIWAQQEADLEAVVIDGASTDGTREWLESRRNRLGTLVSEPDTGVYEAMNKGITAARGDWVLFLGADDRLATPDVFAQVADPVRRTAAGIVAATARFNDGRLYAPQPGAAIRRNFLHHQATFYRRLSFNQHGRFDPQLRIQADYDLNLRWVRAGAGVTTLPHLVAHCGTGGLSDGGTWRNYREEITVRHRHFPPRQCWLWDLGSVARYLRKKIRRSVASHRPE